MADPALPSAELRALAKQHEEYKMKATEEHALVEVRVLSLAYSLAES